MNRSDAKIARKQTAEARTENLARWPPVKDAADISQLSRAAASKAAITADGALGKSAAKFIAEKKMPPPKANASDFLGVLM